MCLRVASIALLAVFVLVAGRPAAAFTLEFVAASKQVYDKPHDVALGPDRRRLFVADNDNDRIAVLDPDSLALIGTFGEDEVGAPHDVAFDADGRLLVADTRNDRIAIYAVSGAAGKLVGELTGPIGAPEGVTAHPNGRIYATGAGSDTIVAFLDGKVVGEAGGLSSPHDVAVAADGTLWVADAGADRLVLRVVEGKPYDFDGPRYLDFDAAGRLYVADKNSHKIKILTPDMDLFSVLGTKSSGKGPGLFDRPEGVAVRDPDVWFADTYNDRIVRYRIVE